MRCSACMRPSSLAVALRKSLMLGFMDIRHGDCLDIMGGMSDDCVDLIVTSPPYADARKDTYGGVKPDKYIDWFLPRAAEMRRILKPTGSLILNIKERCFDGQRHPYVLDLILQMSRCLGFLWVGGVRLAQNDVRARKVAF